MATFEATDRISLGNATWLSSQGDTIILCEGEYGHLPVKPGVSYEFLDGATVAGIIGLGVGLGGPWSASSVSVGDTQIVSPKVDPTLVQCTYLFRKQLPVNSRLPPNTVFAHANGTFITIVGNDKEQFELGGPGGANQQTPKALAQISVPVLQKFDVSLSDQSLVLSSNSDDLAEQLAAAKPHIEARKHAEQIEQNSEIGINLSDMEYDALWALNDFIREYSRATDSPANDRPFSVLSFCDGLEMAIFDPIGKPHGEHSRSVIGSFSNQALDQQNLYDIRSRMLSSQASSLSEMVVNRLNILDYHSAILGMYQEFELLWERDNPQKTDKWEFIEKYTTDCAEKVALAELVNARNWIAHNGILKTEHTKRNRLKCDWGASRMSEFEIFTRKKPWEWYHKISTFKQRNGW
jgi:hypothetical protein